MDDQSNTGGADFVLPQVNPPAQQQSDQSQSDDQVSVADDQTQAKPPKNPTTQPPQAPSLLPEVSNNQAKASEDGHSHIVGAVPEIADDLDLIEKEWVNKAKEIVVKTKGDPHARSAALGKVKVEYLKRRFNKQSKTEDQ